MAELTADSAVDRHAHFMSLAIAQARLAEAAGEVPIGAVLVRDGVVIGEGFNAPISSCDPTAHAEIRAMRQAAERVANYRLTGATLYVTVEPCLMCVGACVHARVKTIVFGTPEPRTGALESTVRAAELPGHNHRCEVIGGVRADECRTLMQEFFWARRGKKVVDTAASAPDQPASTPPDSRSSEPEPSDPVPSDTVQKD